jgi:hypothetical protein
MPTVFASLRMLGLDSGLALALHFVVATAAGVAAWWLLRRVRDPLRRAFVLLAGTLLISPYSFSYDMGALSVTAALIAQTSRALKLQIAAIGIALIAVFPGVLAYLAFCRLPLTPLLLAAGLAAVWHIERNGEAYAAAASEPTTDPRL